MRKVLLRSSGVCFGINQKYIQDVIVLKEKGVKSHSAIAGSVGIPLSYVSKILKVNGRLE
jgi:hypothetical protein